MGLTMGLFFFSKKLVFLLSLEIIIIFLIGIFFFSIFRASSNSRFSILMIFLIFMVLDRVLGIRLLISSRRRGIQINSFSMFF